MLNTYSVLDLPAPLPITSTKRRYRIHYFLHQADTRPLRLRVAFESYETVSALRKYLRARYTWDSVQLAVKDEADGEEYHIAGQDVLEDVVGVDESAWSGPVAHIPTLLILPLFQF